MSYFTVVLYKPSQEKSWSTNKTLNYFFFYTIGIRVMCPDDFRDRNPTLTEWSLYFLSSWIRFPHVLYLPGLYDDTLPRRDYLHVLGLLPIVLVFLLWGLYTQPINVLGHLILWCLICAIFKNIPDMNPFLMNYIGAHMSICAFVYFLPCC